MRPLAFDGTFGGWRAAARAALAARERPQDVTFVAPAVAQVGLFAAPAATNATANANADAAAAAPAATAVRLPRAFVTLAEQVAYHHEPGRWDLLYRLAWRLAHEDAALLQLASDKDVVAAQRMARAVAREVHKCHAYVRFASVEKPTAAPGAAATHYVAWYEPVHDVLALAAPHFVERFGTMDWSILTPAASAHFVAGKLRLGPGAARPDASIDVLTDDAVAALWRTYYVNIFNPARLNLRATRAEMPQRYWANLPETQLIPAMRRQAPARLQQFLAAQPPRAVAQASYPDLAALGADLRGCGACPWHRQATQVVGGEGPATAPLMLVGEQPGDAEDVAGRPFVGPAGQLLAEALQQAGIVRDDAYVTNAVKHFKFVPRGKRRLHQKPSATDVAACRGWLQGELALVRPRVLVCLGTTAALAVRGQLGQLQALRGQVFATAGCRRTLVTYHPSAVLRALPQERAATYAALVDDLRRAQRLLQGEAA